VGGRIDAARQPRCHREARGAELARKALGHLEAHRRGVARARHGDDRPGERRSDAGDRDERRRIVDRLEQGRIVRFAECDQCQPKRAGRVELALGLRARAYASRARRPAAARQFGQRLDGGARTAEMFDEGVKRARPDILAADEAQPIEPLLVAQAAALVFVAPHVVSPAMLAGQHRSGACGPQPRREAGAKTSPRRQTHR
jgi:hypothetical protein